MATSTPSSSQQAAQATKKNVGIDSLLQSKGKSLKLGQTLSFSLVKSSLAFQSKIGDPQQKEKDAPLIKYPLVAKFPESVVRPSFAKMTRMVEQAVPSQKDDSDEEEEEEPPTNSMSSYLHGDQPPKKKMRRRRQDVPKRQWLLQEETDYLETQIAQQEQQKDYRLDPSQYSSRYEGTAEYNPSTYMLVGTNSDGSLEVTILPTPHAVHSFVQPSASAAMSLSQADQHVQDSRMAGTRYKLQHGSNASTNKMRLLNKLKAISKTTTTQEEEGDDVMSDVRFVERKGASGKARMELLEESTDVVTMDGEGVLGGANDGEFGGKRRFAHRQVDSANTANQKGGKADDGGAPGGTSEVGNDGRAMADDFYKRDVKAEYEELDYDANDQFDDDDVDLGEGEMGVMGENGFEDDYETSSDEEGDDDDEYGSGDGSGLASTNGLRAMLAKARGETPATAQGGASSTGAPTGGADEKDRGGADSDTAGDHKRDDNTSDAKPSAGAPSDQDKNPTDGTNDNSLKAVIDAAKQAREKAANKKADLAKQRKANKPTGVEVNAQGERLLTLEAVQREIWLHHGSIPIKKLMKIFSIKKKSASKERKQKFQQLILELCVIKNDPVQGKMLQLKQHYASLE